MNTVNYEANFTKKFMKVLSSITSAKRNYEVFRDFVYMASYAYENILKKSEDIEHKFSEIRGFYTEEQYSKFSELLAILTLAQEEDYRDYLGSVYMAEELYNKNTGQYFTPWSVASMMSAVSVNFESIKEKLKVQPRVSFADSCCGSGVMFLSNYSFFLKEGINQGINPQKHIVYYGQDLDPLVARMCFIQLCGIGAQGVIHIGDSLRYSFSEDLYTPMYALNNRSFESQL